MSELINELASRVKRLDDQFLPSTQQAIYYEAHSSWWMAHMYGNFLQGVAARYLARKVHRKLKRITDRQKRLDEIRRRYCESSS